MNGESYVCEFTSFAKNTHYFFTQIVSVLLKNVFVYIFFFSVSW